MPGIVGIVTAKPRQDAERELLQMVEALRHETFYVSGTWSDESLGVYVGWVAHKGSFSDPMPLCNERGDVTLIFSGEEFTDRRTALRLRERGHSFDLEGPSYLVHLYEDDPAFLTGLNGRFHGVLVDRARGTTTLFNDRYGMHRVYYHAAKEGFYFAAEAKAILRVRPELRKTDMRGMGEFISCGCVMENKTLFEGIDVLPGASAWAFRDRAIERKGAYFKPQEWEEQSAVDSELYYQKLRGVFSERLPRYFNGNQPVGMSLTGGLDTRMILAWHKPPPGSLPCYSFGSMFRDSQDVLLARRVADTCKQSLRVIPVGGDFLSHFPRYAERAVYLTDGSVDVSHSPDLYVNERAREIAPVRMTGNYGGEVLRRIRAFKPVPPAKGLFAQEFLTQVQRAEKTYSDQLDTHPLSFALFRQAPWHHFGLLALEQSQVSLRSPYLDNNFVQTVFQAPESAYASNDICLRLISDGDASLLRFRTDRGIAGVQGRLTGKISRSLLEFTAKAEYAYDYGMPQWVARINHLLSPLRLERCFLGRHKFYHFRVWYRDELSRYVQEILLDSRARSRDYVDRKGIENVVRGHLKSGRNYTTAIHKLLTLELLHRLFIDSR